MTRKTACRALFATALLAGLLLSPAARAAGGSGSGWGYNFYGGLGSGTSSPSPPCFCLTVPTPMAGVSGITQIAASQNTALALLADGTVRAWGNGTTGQLGNGEATTNTAPITPTGLSGVVSVAAGYDYGLALRADGTVMAWGANKEGQLGVGSTSGPETCIGNPCSKRPVPVPGLSGVVAIAARFASSAALLSNGTVVAWGSDTFGQLGDGTGMSSGCKCVDHPVPVPGVSGAVALSDGGFAPMALLADGSVRAWGYNQSGSLGNGTTTGNAPCTCLAPLTVPGLAGVKEISSGSLHQLVLMGDGSVQAWGRNNVGQLGNGAVTAGGCSCIATPGAVPGLGGAQAIAAGSTHSMALLGDGGVRAWGEGEYGAIGDETTTLRASPTPPKGLAPASGIAAGEITSFAISGPSQALNVTVTGSGAGVIGGAGGILCGPSCSARFPQAQVEILRAEPGPTSAFAGFAGACTGTAPCQVRMDQDQSVVATFGPPTGTAITAAKINRKKKTASFSFSAPGPITGYECQLVRPKPKPKKKHKAKRKTKTPPFAPCSSATLYKHLRPGAYTFSVRALDKLGADEHPAVRHFKLKLPKKKRKGAGHKR